MLKTGILSKIIELLQCPKLILVQPCLKICGVCSNGDDETCQPLIDLGGVKGLWELLSSTHKLIRKEALWTLSNITAGSEQQVGAVFSTPGMLEKIITIINTDCEELKIEAVWALCNSTRNCNMDQLGFLINKGILQIYADPIFPENDSKILNVILESVYVMATKFKDVSPSELNGFIDVLFDKGIVEKIEALQRHSNTNVYKKSYRFIVHFLEVDDDI